MSDDPSSPFVARLTVDSDLHSHAELTELVGAPSDEGEGWDRGSTYTVAGRPRTNGFSRWAIVERASDLADSEAAVARLLERARALVDPLARRPPEVRVALALFVTSPADVFGLGLSQEHVELAARLGAALEQSFVVSR